MREFWKNREKGAVIVMFALFIPLLMLCAGLAIDLGNLYAHKTRLQNAADAAALAGARAYAVSGEYGIADTVEAHGYANAEAERYIENNSTTNNKLGASADNIVADKKAAEDKEKNITYYRVSLTETVPLYFLRILGDNFKEKKVVVSSYASIVPEAYISEPARDLFIFKHNFDAVNSIQNPDTDKKGQILNFFDGNIAFTDGTGKNANNAIGYKYKNLQYSSQKDDLAYFFTPKVKDENLSINEAKAKGTEYAFPAIFEDYDMEDLAVRARAKMGLPTYVEDSGWPSWDETKYANWDEYTAATQAYSDAQSNYRSHFKLTTDDNGYYKSLTSSKLGSDLAISANSGDGNVNVTIDTSMGSSSDSPIYLYLDPTIYYLGIDVNVSNGRPLIVVYTGTGSVHINVASGATFSGVYYAPKSEDVLINAEDANFEGTIIAGSMSLRGDNSTYTYKNFIEGQSADGKGAATDKKVNLVGSSVTEKLDWH